MILRKRWGWLKSTIMRTRVKFCGFTREEDIQTAVALGADALGFVLYEKSPRYVTPERVAQLCAHVPAFVSTVALFVNADEAQMQPVVQKAPIRTVRLPGAESFAFALHLQQTLNIPVIKAVRVNARTDWGQIAQYVDHLSGVLLDSDSAGYGGSGHGFDWSGIPVELRSRIILSGGLTVDSVGEAIAQIAPYAVDVSSGIEVAKGIKDADKMRAFMQNVLR